MRTTYPDLLEYVLGIGAGTLIVYSASGRDELRRIHNVPMLGLVRKQIDRLLESTQVTMAPQSSGSAAMAEEAAGEEGENGGEVGEEKL